MIIMKSLGCTKECLKAYITPLAWRPSQLIMVSSNTSSSQQLNSSALLAWGIKKQKDHAPAQPLWEWSLDMVKKCSSLDALNPQNIGGFVYLDDDLVIDYCLFKATDVVEKLVNTCHLQSSPQILIGITLFSALTLRKVLQLICDSRRMLQRG